MPFWWNDFLSSDQESPDDHPVLIKTRCKHKVEAILLTEPHELNPVAVHVVQRLYTQVAGFSWPL